MKKILMLVHTFPPLGSVGGSIRIIKFLKYINMLRPDIFSTIITLRDDIVLLNDFPLAKVSLNEIPQNNIKIIRTNTLQLRHPNPRKTDKIDEIGNSSSKKSKNYLKNALKNLYKFFEKYFLIPDYSILWFPFSIKTACREIKQNKIEIIYATAPPFSVLIQAAIIRKLTDTKLILDIKDDWVYNTKFLSKSFIIKYIESKLERFSVKNADRVILVTQRSYDDFCKRFPRIKEKFSLITNGCDIEEYEPYWKVKYKKSSKFRFIHSGIIANSRNPNGFFDALVELKEEGLISCENFIFKFIGELNDDLKNTIVQKRLNDIIFINKPLEREEYIKEISNTDLLLAFNYQIKTLIPGKIYDYWGSRRPILLIDSFDSIAAELVHGNKLGTVKQFDDINGIKEVIRYYFNLWDKDSELLYKKTNIDNLYKYDRKYLTTKLIEIFDEV